MTFEIFPGTAEAVGRSRARAPAPLYLPAVSNLFLQFANIIELLVYTEQKKLAAAVSRIATNINLVCRRINSAGHFYDADVAELKERMADVWELLKVQQRNEL